MVEIKHCAFPGAGLRQIPPSLKIPHVYRQIGQTYPVPDINWSLLCSAERKKDFIIEIVDLSGIFFPVVCQ